MFWLKNQGNHLLFFPFFFLALVKLFLVSNDSVLMLYAPLDDSLYVNRAYNFLLNFNFGEYDSHLLSKLPGFSLFLAFIRSLGLPYTFFINIFYMIAGIYFIAGLNKFGINKAILFITFVLYLFNPITFDQEWFRLVREPLATILFVLILGSFIHLLNQKNKKNIFSVHYFILFVAFSFSIINREEDILLLFLVIPFLFYLCLGPSGLRIKTFKKINFVKDNPLSKVRYKNFLIVLIPFLIYFLLTFSLKSFIFFNYGSFILNDFNSGEFPKLIGTIKRIETPKQNRYVTLSQERIKVISKNIPELKNIFDLLPKPNKDSYSCKRFNLCSEITDGWSFFWLKDAIFRSENNKSLVDAQISIKRVRELIEKKCNNKEISCSNKRYGLISPFQYIWFKPFIFETLNILDSIFFPKIYLAGHPRTKFELDDTQGKVFQYLAMTNNYDSFRQKSFSTSDRSQDIDTQSLHYWLKYPDVFESDKYGFRSELKNGALQHYLDIGQNEGRVWEIEENFSINNDISNYLDVKKNITNIYSLLFPLLFFSTIGLSLFSFYNNLLDKRKEYMRVFYLFLSFIFFKIIILGHISTFMGFLDFRLFFSIVTVLILISPTLIYKSIKI